MKLEATPFHRRRESYLNFKPFVTSVRASGETRLGAAVDELLLQRRPAGTVVVISDFLVNEGDLEDALKRLVAARHDVKVIHVMGEQESTASYPPGLYRIRDAETGEVRETALDASTAAAIRRKVEKIAARIREICTTHAITYAQAFGAGNLDSFMERELPLLGIVR
jgi:hypothetical protein